MPDNRLSVHVVASSTGHCDIELNCAHDRVSIPQQALPLLSGHPFGSMGHFEAAYQSRTIGLRLFDFLFGASEGTSAIYEDCWRRLNHKCLWIALDFADCAEAENLPWELMRDPVRGYLALTSQVRLHRGTDVRTNGHAIPLADPLPLLGFCMSDISLAELHLLARHLQTSEGIRQLQLDVFPYVSLQATARRFRQHDYGVVMITGRYFPPRGSTGGAMIHPGSGPDRRGLPATALAAEIAPPTCVQIVVLRAAPPGHPDELTAMHHFAHELLEAGIPAVILMPVTVPTESVLLFLGHLLRALAAGHWLAEALVGSRRVLEANAPGMTWAWPVWHSRASHDVLFRPITSPG